MVYFELFGNVEFQEKIFTNRPSINIERYTAMSYEFLRNNFNNYVVQLKLAFK